MSSFFLSTSLVPVHACCGDKLYADVTTCTKCKHKVQTLCTHGGHCFKCVCCVCNELPCGDMRACKTCMHRVHTTCAVHVAFRVEVVCKTYAPRPKVASQPAKKKVRRYFNTKWQIGRPWLQYPKGLMPCLQGVPATTAGEYRERTHKLRRSLQVSSIVGNWRCLYHHYKHIAGTSSQCHRGPIPVYLSHGEAWQPTCPHTQAEAVQLAGGTVTPSYQSHDSVATITHAIAAPIRSVKGAAIASSNFFALAYDSSTDCSANKHHLVYTRSLRNGEARTAVLGLRNLRDGRAESLTAAYKEAMLHAGLPVEEWVARMFWYCANGAKVMMHSNGNGVAKLLMKLQEEVLGYRVVVPLHANCQHANCQRAYLAFRNAMDDTHESWTPCLLPCSLWLPGFATHPPVYVIYAVWP